MTNEFNKRLREFMTFLAFSEPVGFRVQTDMKVGRMTPIWQKNKVKLCRMLTRFVFLKIKLKYLLF